MGNDYTTLILLTVAMFAFFYFFIIRPQKKREKADAEMRSNLEVGDKITTIGGMIGRVVSIKDDETLTFETGADRVKIHINRWAVRSVENEED